MTNDQTKSLVVQLLKADTENAVIAILRSADLWDSAGPWRLYGDRDSNYGTIGNQQSRPEAALVEKIVNWAHVRFVR